MTLTLDQWRQQTSPQDRARVERFVASTIDRMLADDATGDRLLAMIDSDYLARVLDLDEHEAAVIRTVICGEFLRQMKQRRTLLTETAGRA